MSFWDELGQAAQQGALGLTDTVSAGLTSYTRQKVAQEIARHGGQSDLRAESNIAEPSPVPPSGEVKYDFERPSQAGMIKPFYVLVLAGAAGLVFLARRN